MNATPIRQPLRHAGYTARVTTLGELDEAMKAARASKAGAYIEIIGDRMDMPPALAFAHG